MSKKLRTTAQGAQHTAVSSACFLHYSWAGVGSGEWGVGSGETGMGSGEWGDGSGKGEREPSFHLFGVGPSVLSTAQQSVRAMAHAQRAGGP